MNLYKPCAHDAVTIRAKTTVMNRYFSSNVMVNLQARATLYISIIFILQYAMQYERHR